MNKVICIGVPVYNGARHLRQALDALLNQSLDDFRVVALDDGSSDGSYSILEEYAQKDQRVAVFRNPVRTGLIAAWNKVAKLAGEIYKAEYFAWYSDHDWVDEDWLSNLFNTLHENPVAVLAHAATVIVSESGDRIEDSTSLLDNAALTQLESIQAVTISKEFKAGDVVYGLFRYLSLKETGFLPNEVMPDRLLISEISLSGKILFVKVVKRYRRELFRANKSELLVDRQLATLFPPDIEKPRFPFMLHGTYFIRKYVEAASDGGGARRITNLIHALAYLSSIAMKDAFKQEFLEAQQENYLAPYLLLISLVLDQIALANLDDRQAGLIKQARELSDAKITLRDTKARLDKFKTAYQEIKQQLLDESRLRNEAEASVLESNAQNKVLNKDLEDMRQRLAEASNKRTEIEASLLDANARTRELHERLVESGQRLSEEAEIRKTLQVVLGKIEKNPFKFMIYKYIINPARNSFGK